MKYFSMVVSILIKRNHRDSATFISRKNVASSLSKIFYFNEMFSVKLKPNLKLVSYIKSFDSLIFFENICIYYG